MSEDGGLEEVEESFRAAASCLCNWATVAWRASSCARKASTSACNRWQLAHGGMGSVFMEAKSILLASVIQHCERLHSNLPVPSPAARPRPAPGRYRCGSARLRADPAPAGAARLVGPPAAWQAARQPHQ